MSGVNPYEAPQASLQNQQSLDTYDDTSPFSAKGRFGRANYVVYGFGSYFLLMLLMAFVPTIAAPLGNAASLVIGGAGTIIYLMFITSAIIFIIRRLHDLNWTGWFSVLTFVPMANLVIFIICAFIRGSHGPNNYGPPPRPNKVHNVLAGIFAVVMIIAVIGVIAAISIPEYQKYLHKAEEFSQQMPR